MPPNTEVTQAIDETAPLPLPLIAYGELITGNLFRSEGEIDLSIRTELTTALYLSGPHAGTHRVIHPNVKVEPIRGASLCYHR